MFGVAATMLCRPEPTKEGVEPKSLGITAIGVQLITTSTLYVA